MTTILPSSLKQPSKKDYLDALANEHDWPFWLRATVINRYRRFMGKKHIERENPGVKVSSSLPSRKLKPRYREKPLKQHSMKKNCVIVTGFKALVRLNSTGKERPTRKEKIILRKTRYTFWLKGNKHNGGQHVDLTT